MSSFVRPTVVALAGSLLLAVALAMTWPGTHIAEPAFLGPVQAGRLAWPPRNETSGIAASHRASDLLWVHDDSNGAPVLYGVSAQGNRRGALRINGVRNIDWEDVAAFELDGKAWLLVGDIGDNEAKRRNVQLHLVEEPAPDRLKPEAEIVVSPTATWKLTYEDGAHDCESLAVDPVERAIYLMTKREAKPRLYRVALPAGLKDAELVARLAGTVPHLPQPNSLQSVFKNHLGAFRGWPCGMDFAPDGSEAVVVTYGDALIFPRQKGESWPDALARAPVELAPHALEQAEAICFSRDGTTVYVASEDQRKLLRYDRNKR